MSAVHGRLSGGGTIRGRLSSSASISGTLGSQDNHISGSLSAPGTLLGRITPSSGSLLGRLSVTHDIAPYEGSYTVTPKAQGETVLETRGLRMQNDVTVLEIPYYETSNVSGYTVYIADEV